MNLHLDLFLTFARVGALTFGGGYAMISNIRETIVLKKQWMDDDELLEVVTVAESTPGPIAINLATYVGYKKRGVLGSLLATLGVVLPSLVIIFAISLFLDTFMANKYVAYAFTGIQCAVALLIVRAGLDMLKNLPKKPLPLATFAAVFLLMLAGELLAVRFSTVLLILLGGALGIAVYALPHKGRRTDK